MARLNTHLSATPRASRSTTVDSLYRDPTPASQVNRALNDARTSRTSSYSVLSPTESQNSDKENDQPPSRDVTPRPTSKGRRMAPPRLPTPTSGSSSARSANKRRRTNDYNPDDSEIYLDEDADDFQSREDVDEEPASIPTPEEEDEATRYYNPHQDPELRRKVRANIRNHQREMEDNRDELIKSNNNLLLDHLKRQDYYMSKVRQTADATLDSRVMVLASDLAGKKLNNSLHGNAGVGIDIDQFVSKLIYFMKSGGDIRGEEDANDAQASWDDDDEDGDNGDGLDWALLGRAACFPCNKRPPVSSFLLGPLSVQKRPRTIQTRRARSQRQPVGPATRPQEIKQSDLQQSENANLTKIVNTIKSRLSEHIEHSSVAVEEELSQYDEESVVADDIDAACQRHRVCTSPDGEACVSLFDFVINPASFGQSVENLFYVSFLIREGAVKVLHDSDGLPLLMPAAPRQLAEQRDQQVQKHQAVLSLDWSTWQSLIEAFNIKESLIAHRVPEETDLQRDRWYA